MRGMLLLLLWLSCACVPAQTITLAPQLPDSRLVLPKALMLALDFGEEWMSAAWPGNYRPQQAYEGYFNHRKCYRPPADKDGAFTIAGNAGTDFSCNGSTYSGNFLNWASLTTVDLLRYALVGGYRSLDTDTQTQLQTVDLDKREGQASRLTRTLAAGSPVAAALTPFDKETLYLRSCRARLQVSDSVFKKPCSDSSTGLLADLPLRVSVCGDDDTSRDALCKAYASSRKPEGMLQRLSSGFRIGLAADDDQKTALPPRSIGKVDWSAPGFLPVQREPVEWSGKGTLVVPKGNDTTVLAELNTYEGAKKEKLLTPWLRAATAIEGMKDLPAAQLACRSASIVVIRPSGKAFGDVSSAPKSWRDALAALEADPSGEAGNPAPGTLPRTNGSLDLLAQAFRANMAAARVRSSVIETGAQSPSGDASFSLLAKYGGFDDLNEDQNPYRSLSVDGMEKSAGQRAEWDRNQDQVPDAYFSAADGSALLARLREVEAALMEEGTLRALKTLPAAALVDAGQLYLAAHNPLARASSLRRFGTTVDPAGAARSSDANWRASLPDAGNRKVYTTTRSASAEARLVLLDWKQLSAEEQASVARVPGTGLPDGAGEDRLAWAKGARAVEEGRGGQLRRRADVMARPVDLTVLATAETPILLAASTADGLIHGFDPSTGSEQFALLPGALLPQLPAASTAGGSAGLDARMPLNPAVATLDGRRRAVLVAALGHHARGVLALAPGESDKAPRLLAEFTERDHAAMGNVLWAPVVVRAGVSQGGQVLERPFLLTTSGINGRAGLFLLALDNPANTAWQDGINFRMIAVPDQTAALPSHLGPVTTVAGSDGRLQYAWAADLQGRVWRFSLRPDPGAPMGLEVTVKQVFTATDSSGRALAITTAPRIAYAKDGAFIVIVGSGRLLNSDDAAPGANRTESLFAVRDQPGTTAMVTRAQLQQRTTAAESDGSWIVRGDPFTYGANVQGWFLDFPASGERLLTPPQLLAGRLVAATTVVPPDPCVPWRGRFWNVDVLTGLSTGSTGRAGTLNLSRLLVLQQKQEGALTAFRRQGMDLGYAVFGQDPGTVTRAADVLVKDALPTRRLSWREIFNWRTLYEKTLSRP